MSSFLTSPIPSLLSGWGSLHFRKEENPWWDLCWRNPCRKPPPQLNAPLWNIPLQYFLFYLDSSYIHPLIHFISSSSFCQSTKLYIPKVTHKTNPTKQKKKNLKKLTNQPKNKKRYNNELSHLSKAHCHTSLSFCPDFVQVPSSGTGLCIDVAFSVVHADTTMIISAKKFSSWITKCCRIPDLVSFTIIKSPGVIPVTHPERRTKNQLMYRTLSPNRQGTRFWAFTPSAAVLQLTV